MRYISYLYVLICYILYLKHVFFIVFVGFPSHCFNIVATTLSGYTFVYHPPLHSSVYLQHSLRPVAGTVYFPSLPP
ncbi:uncharacterized protein BT62DRAFT_299907 [Guyanagaster necrorhizus]|uniref:Uncharacterized protein n=1 Tax=Guyanagaster necrorhizus TaxID=856835 RepID=A0A9P8AYL9_9AGAR|nr:uncharacterized protein BT62DRAFT_299907 [Guyanagaster necrorhizus MCA 3950]KAG7452361.1 hypothetical protein BT62DRAFT_299907 [Guyanagaster necrorhizus MCA 3950]